MQHPERIYLVLCILGAILIGSNVIMYGVVRSSRGMRFDWFKDFGRTARKPWSKEDEGLEELAKQADKIRTGMEDDQGKQD
jgi:hypothetical protein